MRKRRLQIVTCVALAGLLLIACSDSTGNSGNSSDSGVEPAQPPPSVGGPYENPDVETPPEQYGDAEDGNEHGNGSAGTFEEPEDIKDVRFFMYQIQGLEEDGAVDALAATHYDMLVVEPTATVKGSEDFDLEGMVGKLKAGPGANIKRRLVLAYIDIGEAEDYRTYWGNDWVAPEKVKCGSPGSPDFMLRKDPDGWSGNYVVAFWDPRWVEIMKREFEMLAKAGFDGAYLDWVEAYDDDCVITRAEAYNINPAVAMANFIGLLKATARKINPHFLIVSQNAPYLAVEAPEYLDVIDAIGVEDTFFIGKADCDWGDTDCNDIPNNYTGDYSTDALLTLYKDVYLAAGIPVFSIDYAIQPANVEYAYEKALAAGLIPLVTQVSLAGITTTPPPGY